MRQEVPFRRGQNAHGDGTDDARKQSRRCFAVRSLRILLAAVAALLVYSATASAQDEDGPDYARVGFYVGAGVSGASFTELENEVEESLRAVGIFDSVSVDTGVGFDLYAGYRAHPNVAVEAEFEMIPATDLNSSGFGTVPELQTWTLTGNFKVFPITGRVQPFGLVGIGVLHGRVKDIMAKDIMGVEIKDSELDFVARFGAGVDLYITEHFALSAKASYVVGTGADDVLDYVSFGGGAQYRF